MSSVYESWCQKWNKYDGKLKTIVKWTQELLKILKCRKFLKIEELNSSNFYLYSFMSNFDSNLEKKN